MSIRKWGNGWQVRVRPFPEITVPTKTAAETVDLDLRLRRKLGHLYVEKPTRLGDELDRHEQRKATLGGKRGKLRPRSLEFVRQNVAPWEPLRDVLIPNLRRAVVEDHILIRAASAPVAARNELQELKTALRAAQSRGQQVDPGILAIEPIRHEAIEGIALELDDLDAIAAWMPERVARLVPFCGTVGLRWSEAVHLDDGMVDLAGTEIMIPRSLNKSRRAKAIPLAACEIQLLREQRMARPTGTSLLFPNAEGGVYSKSGFRSVWLPALLEAGFAHRNEQRRIVADFRFHWLRHTAISLMCRAGMKPELIAQRVGHSDGGALIYRRYRHLFPSELRAAVGLVDELVRSQRGQEVDTAEV